MRFAAVVLVAFACSGVFASAAKQTVTTDSAVTPAPVQSEPRAEARQSHDSDMVVKELHSPITFDLDASWLPALPIGDKRQIRSLPRFFCDGITLESIAVAKHKSVEGVGTYFAFDFSLRQREPAGDGTVVLEFALLNGEEKALIAYRENLEISGKVAKDYTAQGFVPEETFTAFTATAAHPRLRVSMIVLKSGGGVPVPWMLPIPMPIPIR